MENFRKFNEPNRKRPKLKHFISFFYSMIEMIGNNIIVYFASLFTRKRMYTHQLYSKWSPIDGKMSDSKKPLDVSLHQKYTHKRKPYNMFPSNVANKWWVMSSMFHIAHTYLSRLRPLWTVIYPNEITIKLRAEIQRKRQSTIFINHGIYNFENEIRWCMK